MKVCSCVVGFKLKEQRAMALNNPVYVDDRTQRLINDPELRPGVSTHNKLLCINIMWNEKVNVIIASVLFFIITYTSFMFYSIFRVI